MKYEHDTFQFILVGPLQHGDTISSIVILQLQGSSLGLGYCLCGVAHVHEFSSGSLEFPPTVQKHAAS